MTKEQEIIGDLLNSSSDFLATSEMICKVLEAVKEECRHADTKKIDALIINEHEKRNLPHPDIIRRTNALKELPDLVKPLIKAAMKDQITSVGELCVPGRDDVDDDYPVNEDFNVFSKEVIERYGIRSGDAWKPEGYDMAEMTLHTAGELKALFEKHGSGDISFEISIEADEEELQLVIDSVESVDYLFDYVHMHVGTYPKADEIENLIAHMKKHPNPNLLIQSIKYPKR